jgi:hypothetical protein
MTQYFDDVRRTYSRKYFMVSYCHLVLSSNNLWFFNNDFYVVNNMGLSLMKKTKSEVFCIFKMWQGTLNYRGRTSKMSNDVV